MLLEVLSDFQISIPELGRVESRTHPVVLLTSNNSRELTEALKRRCLYLWLDYPELEHELEIVRLHAPELSETVARRLVEVIGMVRELDLKKPPSIAESIDWARALLLLGVEDIDERHVHRDDVGDRQAPHRHGRRGRARRAEARVAGRCRLSAARLQGLPARHPRARRGAAPRRRRGRHLGAARRVRGAARDRLDRRRRTSARRWRRRSPRARRTGACSSWCSTASSSARSSSRGGRARACREDATPATRRARPTSSPTKSSRRCARRSPPRCATARRARCATSRGWRSPRSRAARRARA